jgi:hypothetical protein
MSHEQAARELKLRELFHPDDVDMFLDGRNSLDRQFGAAECDKIEKQIAATAAALAAAEAKGRADAFEEAAKIADEQARIANELGNSGEQWAYEDMAQRIRARSGAKP